MSPSIGSFFLACALLAQTNPYRDTGNFGELPGGRKWGSSSAVDIDRDGRSVWIAERCGANSCAADTTTPPVMKFDPSGKLLKSFGAGLFVFPHGIYVDKDNNIWITDGQGRDGKGHQVFKFNQDGKILLKLGKAGVAGTANDEFNQPSDVLVAPNGDIFVADGHGGARSNARIMKFDKTGKFIKTWGKFGKGRGEFDCPHALAMDSKGRLFVGDRFNNRIQVFDQEGNYLAEWAQFSRPSGLFIDKKDRLYVADSESTDRTGYGHNPGWKRGLRIGSAKDGRVEYFIPDPSPASGATSAAEGVAADSKGIVYGAEVLSKSVQRYEK